MRWANGCSAWPKPPRCCWSPIRRRWRRAPRGISASPASATRPASSLLDDEARLEEIARMLSGANVTDEARAAAKRLMAEARAPPKKTRKRA